MSRSPMDEQVVEVLGEPLRCQVCRHDGFFRREGKLNTTMATFLGVDWADASATCFVCSRCGYIHWFLPRPVP